MKCVKIVIVIIHNIKMIVIHNNKPFDYMLQTVTHEIFKILIL